MTRLPLFTPISLTNTTIIRPYFGYPKVVSTISAQSPNKNPQKKSFRREKGREGGWKICSKTIFFPTDEIAEIPLPARSAPQIIDLDLEETGKKNITKEMSFFKTITMLIHILFSHLPTWVVSCVLISA